MSQTDPTVGYEEWPATEPTRNCWLCFYPKKDPAERLNLRATSYVGVYGPETVLTIHAEDLETHQRIAHVLKARALWLDSSRPRPGSWHRYLLELEAAHLAVEMLGWELTPAERAVMASLDAYAQECPSWVRRRVAMAV